MSTLKIILIDVGWGDSIFIESIDNHGDSKYALIDSNDTSNFRSSYIFIKRYLERKGIDIDSEKPIFEFVMLSHAHADHAQGLKSLMRSFGTKYFFYPKSINWSSFIDLIRYSNRSSNVNWHQAVDNTNQINDLGDVAIRILWPEPDTYTHTTIENNNSIVMELSLDGNAFLISGDAEGYVWDQIKNDISSDLLFFKVPHHGSKNGAFYNNIPCWINHVNRRTQVAISSHVKPFNHPHKDVINLFNPLHLDEPYRTDQHYHLTYEFDGNTLQHSMKYSH